MAEHTPANTPATELTLRRLRDLRRPLLRLHKALLDGERAAYEQAHGRVASSGELLQLVIGDEWFAWLRPISELVVQIDEVLDAEEPAEERDAAGLLTQARVLLTPAETGESFERKYYAALQRDPEVVLAHSEVVKLLAAGA